MRAFQTFSTTAATNASNDPSINWANGQPAASVNDSARAQMAREAALFQGISGGISLGGSSNAYTFTSPSGHALTAYPTHLLIVAKANHTNTGAATLNVDGLGTKSIVKSASTALAAGDIVSGAIYLFSYDGTNFQVLGEVGAPVAWSSFGRSLVDDADDAAARTTLGLVIGTHVQAFNARLADIATNLSATSGAIEKTGANTFGVYTVSSFGKSLIDDADAAAARTTLSLGTSATVNTGTSGATIPLLNGANTWSSANTFSGADGNVATFFRSGAAAKTRWIETSGNNAWGARNDNNTLAFDYNGTDRITVTAAGVMSINSNTVWHAGNDGAGSGLDADTVDGLQASAFPTLSATLNTFSGASGDNFGASWTSGGTHIFSLTRVTNGVRLSAFEQIELWFGATSGASSGTRGVTVDSSGLTVNAGTLQATPRALTTTSGTLVAADANCSGTLTGNITMPNSVFSGGQMQVFNGGASNRTFTRGSGVTMYLNGSNVATATLPANQMGGAFWSTASVVHLSGAFTP